MPGYFIHFGKSYRRVYDCNTHRRMRVTINVSTQSSVFNLKK